MNEVSDNDVDDPEIGKWDPGLTERVMGVMRPVLKTYFRSEVIPPNLPLPTKIVTQVLEPIDVAAQFGEDPDTDEVDEHVRSVMQQALYGLGRQAPFPDPRLNDGISIQSGPRSDRHHAPRQVDRAHATADAAT